jgi:hypothetical protein
LILRNKIKNILEKQLKKNYSSSWGGGVTWDVGEKGEDRDSGDKDFAEEDIGNMLVITLIIFYTSLII